MRIIHTHGDRRSLRGCDSKGLRCCRAKRQGIIRSRECFGYFRNIFFGRFVIDIMRELVPDCIQLEAGIQQVLLMKLVRRFASQKNAWVTERILQFSKMAERSLLIATDKFERKLGIAREKWMKEFSSMRSSPRKRRKR